MAARPSSPTVDQQPLQRLAEMLLQRIDVAVERAIDRMQAQLPSYGRVEHSELTPVVRESARRILLSVGEPLAPLDGEDDHYRQAGEVRASQGISSDEMLHAWRIGLDTLREEARAAVEELGLPDRVLLEFLEATLRLGDVGMVSSASAHRAAELELSRHEQDQRANIVRGVLFGTLSPAVIHMHVAAYGLDAAAAYRAVRARPGPGVTVRSLERQLAIADAAGPRRGLAALLDGDLAGFVLDPLPRAVRDPIGVGPAASLTALEGSFRLATRALDAALASARTGPVTIEELGLAPALIADVDVGEALRRRIVEPVLAHGAGGAVLLESVTRYLRNDLRLEVTAAEMFVHVNTLRYRLRRFEELTGTSLRCVDDLVEIWWAIRRHELAADARQPAQPL